MKSDEIRQAFLDYFVEKGHTVVPSSSLVPKGDPTLLLTNAGMVQMKPYFLGEAEPPNVRMASSQKCFRTSDIDEVGDATHHTFFEMLGNFSVADYFKKEAITWGWELVTERMKIPPEKLWISIYLDDDEAYQYWREIGIPENRIFRFDESENFWGPAGNSGPCGPDSEIFYDFGVEKGCGKPDCAPNCECGRFTELWNLVFVQYNQDESGHRTPLPKKNIDTGMGLERMCTVLQGKDTAYETDLFAPLIETVSGVTGKAYGAKEEDDVAMRVLADHGRAITFLIADGVIPGNEGRDYVLRRLLRRTTLFGFRLGLDKPFLSELAKTTIKQMNHVYPELKQRRDFILQAIESEETRFDETLKTGLEVIEDMISRHHGKEDKQISGADAFRLYDTYGFPVELTQEVVAKSGFTVDMDGFEKEMEKQRERARSSQKFDVTADASRIEIGVAATQFVGYNCTEKEAQIIGILVDGEKAEKIEKDQEAGIILNKSPFYGEMGGQVGDTGEIFSTNGRFLVTDTVRLEGEITLHKGKVTDGYITSGEKVTAVVDTDRRKDIARNHTATHLLQSALREVLGEHIQQRGSLVAPDRLRFDFSHLKAVSPEEIKRVQRTVNEKIRQNLPVCDEESSYKEAINAGVIAIFDEKYGDVVRVMKIGEPQVSAELCGGTHVSATGEIGYFQIINESSIGAGLRRIEAVTGRGAEAFIDSHLAILDKTAHILKTTPEQVPLEVEKLKEDLEFKDKRLQGQEIMSARREAESLSKQVQKINGIDVLAVRVSVSISSQKVLREMTDFIRDRLPSSIIVLGAIIQDRPFFIATVTPDLVEKGYNAGNIIKQVSKVTGGGGGGRPDFAQAGGKDKGKLDEALNLVKKLI